MKLFFKGLTEGQVYIDLDGNGTYETYDLNDIQGGLDLDENLDYSKIQVKANSKVFSNLQVIKNFEIQKIENQLGSDESESVLEYLYCYDVGDSAAFYSFDRIEDVGIYEGYFIENQYVGITRVNIVSFSDDGHPVNVDGISFSRAYKRDTYKRPPKDELVEVEFVGGYSGLLSGKYYNFATNTDSYGNTYTNQRLVVSGYCAREDCDLAIYIGSGRIGYYRIVQ